MSHPLPEPGSPADWLRHARSDLLVAQTPTAPGVLRETLCYHLQQAAEKSLKAVLIYFDIAPPRTHNLKMLIELMPAAFPVPDSVASAASLTDYAVTTRYPGDYEPIPFAQAQDAVQVAQRVRRQLRRWLPQGSRSSD